MAASLVFRRAVCSQQRVLLNSCCKSTIKPSSNTVFYRSNLNRNVRIFSSSTSSSENGSNNHGNNLSDESNETEKLVSSASTTLSPEGALHKFAKVVEKVEADTHLNEREIEDIASEADETFASMLRNSKLIAMGEAKDKRVLGQIVEVMEDDLYVDFGGKFHCVCPRPRKNAEKYQRGSQVILNLNSMEMSSAFLGSNIHVTLLEADAILLGLHTPKEGQTSINPQ